MIDSFLACIMLWGVMLFCAVAAETGSIMKALQAHKTDCHKFIHPFEALFKRRWVLPDLQKSPGEEMELRRE
jgi:hypothetical protein